MTGTPPVREREEFRGYVRVRSRAAHWLVRRDCAPPIERGDADFLFDEDAGAAQPAGSGRGPMVRLRLGRAEAIAKRARHGGLLGPILGRQYLGERRGLDQVSHAIRLREAGIETPEILAVGSARTVGPLRTQVLVSREIPDGRDLVSLARTSPPPTRRRTVLAQAGRLVRSLHDAGFLHADLNAGNLVLERHEGGDRLHVVDLDRGRFHAVLSPAARLRNLARLVRSYEKWIAPVLRLSPREEIRFLRHYAEGDGALLRSLARRLSRGRPGSKRRTPRRRVDAAPDSRGRMRSRLQ